MSGSVVTITRFDFATAGGRRAARQGVTAAAVRVHGQAVALCPVDFGQLRNSLMWITEQAEGGFNESGSVSAKNAALFDRKVRQRTRKSAKAPAEAKLVPPQSSTSPDVETAYVGTNSDHWYPEFGTRYQIAQPFLRPAMDIVVKGGKAAEIAVKYGREAMEEEFRKRKTRVSNA